MVKIIQNYTLHEQIGQGQFGKVYRGVDNNTGREVAAKVISVGKFKDNKKLQECTLNQIQVLSKIDSPYVVKFIQILKTVNNFYFFYQFCNGGTLDSQIKKKGFLKQDKLTEYLEQILQAFKQLTSHNIIHRDLKPTNIMLHNGKIKIGDFGFCKSLQNQRDLAQTMLGSPIYMAPQVLRGQIYTIKADIWSLGVVVFQMAFGYCPFEESSIAGLINLLKNQQIIINRQINPISIFLQNFIKRCLVKDHFKRSSWDQIFASFDKQLIIQNNVLQPLYQQINKLNKQPFPKQKVSSQLKFFKKKTKGDEDMQQINHKKLLQFIKLADKILQQDKNQQVIDYFVLKIYKFVLGEHIRLCPKISRQRDQLSSAIFNMQLIIQKSHLKKQQLLQFILNKNMDKKQMYSTTIEKLQLILQGKDRNMMVRGIDTVFRQVLNGLNELGLIKAQ